MLIEITDIEEIMISFEKFEECIKTIKNYDNTDNSISELLNTEGFIMYSAKATRIILDLLESIFDDTNEWIDYFIYELEYGSKWTPESCFNSDQSIIDINDAKKLYEFLIKNMGE